MLKLTHATSWKMKLCKEGVGDELPLIIENSTRQETILLDLLLKQPKSF